MSNSAENRSNSPENVDPLDPAMEVPEGGLKQRFKEWFDKNKTEIN